MSKYERGSWHRVEAPVARLTRWVPVGNGALTLRGDNLWRGDLIRCAGVRYSGGSDGIDRPYFDRVIRGADVLPDASGEFQPNSWGWPTPESLTACDEATAEVCGRLVAVAP